MDRGKSTLNRATGLLLVTLLPVLGASIPVLDISPEDGRTGVESHHHPGTHGLPHNHLICIQMFFPEWQINCKSCTFSGITFNFYFTMMKFHQFFC